MNIMNLGHVLGRNEMKKIMAGCGSYCYGGDGSNGGSADCDEIECKNGTTKCIETCSISASEAQEICNQSTAEGITCRPGLCC